MRLDQFVRMFENQPWMTEAACKGMPASIFIPDVPDRRDRQGHRRYERALAVCDGCPVTAECAEYGRDERRGVWGGTTPTDRDPRRIVPAPAKHGTESAYQRHYLDHTPPCDLCKAAHTRAKTKRNQDRKVSA